VYGVILHVSQLSNVNGCFRRFAALDIDRDDAWLTFAGSVVVAALDIDRDDAWLTFAGICRREKNSRERDDAESGIGLCSIDVFDR